MKGVLDMQDLAKFITNLKQSLMLNELVWYYQEHPKAYKTIEGLAVILNTTPEELEPVIHYLERQGILHNCGPIWGSPFYVNKYIEFYSLNPKKKLGSRNKTLNFAVAL